MSIDRVDDDDFEVVDQFFDSDEDEIDNAMIDTQNREYDDRAPPTNQLAQLALAIKTPLTANAAEHAPFAISTEGLIFMPHLETPHYQRSYDYPTTSLFTGFLVNRNHCAFVLFGKALSVELVDEFCLFLVYLLSIEAQPHAEAAICVYIEQQYRMVSRAGFNLLRELYVELDRTASTNGDLPGNGYHRIVQAAVFRWCGDVIDEVSSAQPKLADQRWKCGPFVAQWSTALENWTLARLRRSHTALQSNTALDYKAGALANLQAVVATLLHRMYHRLGRLALQDSRITSLRQFVLLNFKPRVLSTNRTGDDLAKAYLIRRKLKAVVYNVVSECSIINRTILYNY